MEIQKLFVYILSVYILYTERISVQITNSMHAGPHSSSTQSEGSLRAHVQNDRNFVLCWNSAHRLPPTKSYYALSKVYYLFLQMTKLTLGMSLSPSLASLHCSEAAAGSGLGRLWTPQPGQMLWSARHRRAAALSPGGGVDGILGFAE